MNDYVIREKLNIKNKLLVALVLLGIKVAFFYLASGIGFTAIFGAPFLVALVLYIDFEKYFKDETMYIVGIILAYLGFGIISGTFFLMAFLDKRKLIMYMKQHEINDSDKKIINQKSNEAFPNVKVKKVEETISPEAKKMDILMKFGVALVMLAGFLFATTISDSLFFDKIKPFFILLLSFMFLGLSYFFKTKVVIKKSENSYYVLFHLFLILFLISLGYYQTLGEWFSFEGDGSNLLLSVIAASLGISFRIIGNKFETSSMNIISHVIFYLSVSLLLVFFDFDLVSYFFATLIYTGIITILLKYFFATEMEYFIPIRNLFIFVSAIYVLFNINGLDLWIDFICNLVIFLLLIGNVMLLAKDNYRKIGSIVLSFSVCYFEFFLCKIVDVSLPDFLDSNFNFIFILNLIFISLHLYNSKTKLLEPIFTNTLICLIALNSFLSFGFYFNPICSLLNAFVILVYIVFNLFSSDDNIVKEVLFFGQYLYVFIFILLLNESLIELFDLHIFFPYYLFILLGIFALINYLEDKLLVEFKIDKLLNPILIVATSMLGVFNLFELPIIFNLIVFGVVIGYRFYVDKVDKGEVFLNIFLFLIGFIHLVYILSLYVFDYIHIILFVILLIFVLIFRKNKRVVSMLILLSFIPYYHFISDLPIMEEVIEVLIILPLLGLVHLVSKCIFDLDNLTRFIFEIIGMSIIFLTYIFEIYILYAIFNLILAGIFIYVGNKFEKFNSLFYEGIGLMTFNIIIQFKDYWLSIPIYVYIFLVGILIVGYVTYKEFNKTKGKVVKKKEDKEIVYYQKKEYNLIYNVLGFVSIVGFIIMNVVYLGLLENAEKEANKIEFNKLTSKFIKENNLDEDKYFFHYDGYYNYRVYVLEYNTIDPYKFMDYVDISHVSVSWYSKENFDRFLNDYDEDVYYYDFEKYTDYYNDDEKPYRTYVGPLFNVAINTDIYDYNFSEKYQNIGEGVTLNLNQYEAQRVDICVYSNYNVDVSVDGDIEKYLDDGNRICYYVSDSDNVSFTTYRTNYPGYYNDNNNDYYVQDGDGSYYYEEDYNY